MNDQEVREIITRASQDTIDEFLRSVQPDVPSLDDEQFIEIAMSVAGAFILNVIENIQRANPNVEDQRLDMLEFLFQDLKRYLESDKVLN